MINRCINCREFINGKATRCRACWKKHIRKNKPKRKLKRHRACSGKYRSMISRRRLKSCYHPPEFRKISQFIRQRDNWQCQICNKNECECDRKLDVHCINYDKHDIHPYNLIALCQKCHGKTNYNRKYWQYCLKNKVKIILKHFDFREKIRV